MISYIRIFHGSPNISAIDVYANEDLIAENIDYKSISHYIPMEASSYNIRIYPTGINENPIVDTQVYIPPNTVFNVAAIGSVPNLNLYSILEPNIAQNSENACIRFIHFSPTTKNIDMRLEDNIIIADDIAYKGISNYICLPPKEYTFKINSSEKDNLIFTTPRMILDKNTYYTVYIIDADRDDTHLEAILIPEPRE